MIPNWDDQFNVFIPLTEEEEKEIFLSSSGIGPSSTVVNKVRVPAVNLAVQEAEDDDAMEILINRGKPVPLVAQVLPLVPAKKKHTRVFFGWSDRERAERKAMTEEARARQAAAVAYYAIPANRAAHLARLEEAKKKVKEARAARWAPVEAKDAVRMAAIWAETDPVKRKALIEKRLDEIKKDRLPSPVRDPGPAIDWALRDREARKKIEAAVASGGVLCRRKKQPLPIITPAVVAAPVLLPTTPTLLDVAPLPVIAPVAIHPPSLPPVRLPVPVPEGPVRSLVADDLMMQGVQALEQYLHVGLKEPKTDAVINYLVLVAAFTFAKLTRARVVLNQDASRLAIGNELAELIAPYNKGEGELAERIWDVMDYVTSLVKEGETPESENAGPAVPEAAVPQTPPRPEILEHDIHEVKHNPLSEDAEYAAAAAEVGSSLSKSKGGKVPRLVHDLSPTNGKAWSQICTRAAQEWTRKLRKEKKGGEIEEGQYDGHTITPEEWNNGGYNAFLQKRMGPDRRSQYQYFSRNQRKRVKEILRTKGLSLTTKLGKRQWKKTLKSLDAVALREELASAPAAKKPRNSEILANAEDEESLAMEEKKEEEEELDLHFSPISDAKLGEEPIVISARSPPEQKVAEIDVWEGLLDEPVYSPLAVETPEFCFACGGDKDEFAQVCPTCMRAGPGLQDITTEREYPWDTVKGLNEEIRREATEIQQELDLSPTSFHFYDSTLLKVLTKWGLEELEVETSSSQRLVYARHLFVALVQVGVYLLNKHLALGAKLASAVEFQAHEPFMTRLICDVHVLLGFYFFRGDVPSWKLMPTEAEFEEQGIYEPDFLDFLDEGKIEPSSKLSAFLDGRTRVWKQGEGLKLTSKDTITTMRNDASRFARLRMLTGCLVDGLLVHSYPRAGEDAHPNLVTYTQGNIDKAISLFDKLNRSPSSRAKGLLSVCEGIRASFASNLTKFLSSEDN